MARDQPLREAEAALRAGEVVVVLPQGTIPRGPAFFDPVLHGKTGTARLAVATGAPVVPVGLWGTERVWPRSSRVPEVAGGAPPPDGPGTRRGPLELEDADAVAATTALMLAITDLLPSAARRGGLPDPRGAR